MPSEPQPSQPYESTSGLQQRMVELLPLQLPDVLVELARGEEMHAVRSELPVAQLLARRHLLFLIGLRSTSCFVLKGSEEMDGGRLRKSHFLVFSKAAGNK